jgi:hypothetical protein
LEYLEGADKNHGQVFVIVTNYFSSPVDSKVFTKRISYVCGVQRQIQAQYYNDVNSLTRIHALDVCGFFLKNLQNSFVMRSIGFIIGSLVIGDDIGVEVFMIRSQQRGISKERWYRFSNIRSKCNT